MLKYSLVWHTWLLASLHSSCGEFIGRGLIQGRSIAEKIEAANVYICKKMLDSNAQKVLQDFETRSSKEGKASNVYIVSPASWSIRTVLNH